MCVNVSMKLVKSTNFSFSLFVAFSKRQVKIYGRYQQLITRMIQNRNRISTQNLTPCMSEIRPFSVASLTHALFFTVGGITSYIQHDTKVGRRSDTPWCLLFDSYIF